MLYSFAILKIYKTLLTLSVQSGGFMKRLSDCFTLNDYREIPCIGFGTWKIPDGKQTYDSVRKALDLGYRHIDTAFLYANESSVGKAVRDSGIPRKEIFVTSKLWGTDRGYESALKGCEKSLDKLGLDYIDLYLIHWPANAKNYSNWQEINRDTWKAFEELRRSGKVASIGLSNFLPHHILSILESCTVTPAVNQIEIHPGYRQSEVVDFCRENGILTEAYRPLGRGAALENNTIVSMAHKYGKTPAQICIRWSLQHGILPLPKSVHEDRMRENADVFDFEITPSDMNELDSIPTFGFSGQHPDETDF